MYADPTKSTRSATAARGGSPEDWTPGAIYSQAQEAHLQADAQLGQVELQDPSQFAYTEGRFQIQLSSPA